MFLIKRVISRSFEEKYIQSDFTNNTIIKILINTQLSYLESREHTECNDNTQMYVANSETCEKVHYHG